MSKSKTLQSPPDTFGYCRSQVQILLPRPANNLIYHHFPKRVLTGF
jgi:hypothetical protein